VKRSRDQRRSQCGEKKAYSDAMVRFQDEYHDAVGEPCGLQRIGPQVQRLSTTEVAARKREAKRLKKKEADLDSERAWQESREQELKQLHQDIMKHESDLADKSASLANSELEFMAVQEAILDAMLKFSQPYQECSKIELSDYAYAAYDVEPEKRTKFQRMVTYCIDRFVETANLSGKSSVDAWNNRSSYRR
jgi:hypothetical protein